MVAFDVRLLYLMHCKLHAKDLLKLCAKFNTFFAKLNVGIEYSSWV